MSRFCLSLQPELCVLVSGVVGRVLCHGGVRRVDPHVPVQGAGGAEDGGGVHDRDLQQQGQVRGQHTVRKHRAML